MADGQLLTATIRALDAAMLAAGGMGPAPAKNEISGTCEIAAHGDTALKAPCNGIEVVLKKSFGEVARVRVDNGKFRFSGLQPGTYVLVVDSPKFKLAGPIQKLQTGLSYLISLK
jgi:hypothetical protein